MLIGIFIPHVSVLWNWMRASIERLRDRAWTSSLEKCSSKRETRLELQSEWEELYIGPEFQMQNRLSHVIAAIWVTFLYSAGLPLLYFIMAASLLLTFYVDKVLLINFYKVPKTIDTEKSLLFAAKLMKLAVWFHFLVGTLLFSNRSTLAGAGSASELLAAYKAKSFKNTQLKLFIYCQAVLIVIMYGGEILLSRLQVFEGRKKPEDAAEQGRHGECYYHEIQLKALLNQYERMKERE